MFENIMQQVKETTPLVHCITNYVTVNDCANAILAVKGSPIMADDEAEVTEITSICSALLINIGTLNKRSIASMIKAGKKANALRHPVILDPVGAGASTLRKETTAQLLKEVKFAVIRGNISEIKMVYAGSGTTSGVDANVADTVTMENLDETIMFAKKLSRRTGAVITITGAIDIVADADKAYVITNGCAEMSSITGTGCMLGAIMGAYAGANPDNLLDAAACATALMGYSGELAKERMFGEFSGTGSLRVHIIDYLSCMDYELLSGGIKIEVR